MFSSKYSLAGLLVSVFFLPFLSVGTVGTAAADAILTNGTVIETLFSVTMNKKKMTCGGLIKSKFLAGRTVTINNATLFIPLNDDMKALKAKLKSAKDTKAKGKIQKKISKLKTRIKNENKICKAGPGGASGTPTATPGPGGATPTRTPTPTPQPSTGNFDANGDVTEKGKAKFGIPSNLSANKFKGQELFKNECRGCHQVEETGFSYGYYKTVTAVAPMYINYLSDQNYADITAYLRRFEFN